MTTGLAITIIALLGAITGGIGQRFIHPLWLASLAAATISTVAWLVGFLFFCLLAAPNELAGPPGFEADVFTPLLMTFLTALFPAFVMGYGLKALREERRSRRPGTTY